jgi:hypothetical protein
MIKPDRIIQNADCAHNLRRAAFFHGELVLRQSNGGKYADDQHYYKKLD